MAIPPFNQLDDVQQKIVGLDPLAEETRRLLVTGPPGSGKSVVAVHRALEVIAQMPDQSVLFLTYNHTLNAYMQTYRSGVIKAALAGTGEAGRSGKASERLKRLDRALQVQTRDEWVRSWSASLPGRSMRRREYVYPWEEWCDHVESGSDACGGLSWPYIIVDEGQDFPPGFYQFASVLIDHGRCPGISVFADENQAIHESQNSTIDQICEALRVGEWNENEGGPEYDVNGKDLFLLTKNYRNTKEIYRVAREFRTGQRTGFTQDPERSGRRPELMECQSLSDFAKRVAADRRSRRGDAVLLVEDTTQLGNMVRALGELGVSDVQYFYGWNKSNRDEREAQTGLSAVFAGQSLQFGGDVGRVTVLCDASVKGLEFDDVYLLIRNRDCRKAEERRQLFVSLSRPRERLTLIADGKEGREKLLGRLGLESAGDMFYEAVPEGVDRDVPF